MDYRLRSVRNVDYMNSIPRGNVIPCFTKQTLQLYALELDNALVEPATSFSLTFGEYNRIVDLKNASRQRIAQRLSNGGYLYIAFHKNEPAGYIFSSISHCRVDEVEQTLHIMPYECYLYDAYTYPRFRGQGIYPALLIHVSRIFQANSYHRALIFTLARNRASIRGIQKAGFIDYGTVEYFRILGHRFWRYHTNNGCIKSYFDDQK